MAADAVRTLVYGHIVALAQKPSGGKPGNSRAYDCDFEAKIVPHVRQKSRCNSPDQSARYRPLLANLFVETIQSFVWITRR
jgi:hypothetical protein